MSSPITLAFPKFVSNTDFTRNSVEAPMVKFLIIEYVVLGVKKMSSAGLVAGWSGWMKAG